MSRFGIFIFLAENIDQNNTSILFTDIVAGLREFIISFQASLKQ
jgi:hypothetical protein